jgi:hypothetical protein
VPKFINTSRFVSSSECRFSYCELLEAKGIMCAHSFTSLLLPYLQKEMQASTRIEAHCHRVVQRA